MLKHKIIAVLLSALFVSLLIPVKAGYLYISDNLLPDSINPVGLLETDAQCASLLPGRPELLQCRFNAVQDSLNARFVGNWPFGFAYTLTLDTSHKIAFVSSGGGVFILDIAAPQTPVKLGEIRCRGVVGQIKFQDSILFISDGWDKEIKVWNVTDPSQPENLGGIPLRPATGFDVKGRYLYAGKGDSLIIFDIQNPALPVRVGAYKDSSLISVATVSDSWAFVTVDWFSGDTGFKIVNISNPAAPFRVGSWKELPVNGLAAANEYVYCATDSGLQIIDLSNPANPQKVGSCRPLDIPTKVAVRDSYAYVADYGLTIINVSNPVAPFVVANIRPRDYWGFDDVALVDSFACLTGWSKMGFWIVNIKNPTAPFEAGWYQVPCWSSWVAVNGDYAYLTDWEYGMRILNITNPAYPYELGEFQAEYGSAGVVVRDTLAYLSECGKGLRIINVKEPTTPVEIGFCQTPGAANMCALKDSFAFVADGMDGLRVIDVANPASPYEIGFFDTPGYAWFVAVKDSLAYVADEAGGLRIINIQNPGQPYEIGAVVLANHPVVLSVWDSLAYCGGYYYDMVIVNVKDPSQPYPVSLYQTYGPSWGVDISFPYAYVSDWFLVGFHIVDVSEPTNPIQVGYYKTPNCPYGLQFISPYVYVTTGLCGLQIYESMLIGLEEKGQEAEQSRAVALAVYPNPAGPYVNIRLNNPAVADARLPILQIYDVNGRVVKSLKLKDNSGQEMRIPLADISPGVYLLRMQAGRFTATGKIVLQK